jgi:hypothetical protein
MAILVTDRNRARQISVAKAACNSLGSIQGPSRQLMAAGSTSRLLLVSLRALLQVISQIEYVIQGVVCNVLVRFVSLSLLRP